MSDLDMVASMSWPNFAERMELDHGVVEDAGKDSGGYDLHYYWETGHSPVETMERLMEIEEGEADGE